MVREFILSPKQLDKWMHQNKAQYTGAFFDGSLLDNFILQCKRGFAAVYEKYLNCWSSAYRVVYAKESKDIDNLFADFYERKELYDF